MAWEPDTRAGNFIPNMAVVVCKGAFHDAPDPQLQTKVGHFMTIARVSDCIDLLPFDQLWEAFNSYVGAATAIGLVRLHRFQRGVSTRILPILWRALHYNGPVRSGHPVRHG